jgi:hypothetical protein
VVQIPYYLTAIQVARIEDALCKPPELITPIYITQLASNYRTTIQTIYRYKRRINAGFRVGQPAGGPHPIITWPIEQAIKHLLDQMPWYY